MTGCEIPVFTGMTGWGRRGRTWWGRSKTRWGRRKTWRGAAMMGSADCWRRDRLEFLDPLSFPPISSRLGCASRAPSTGLRTGSARTEARYSFFAGDRLGELEEWITGLERFLVTTCHGPRQSPGQSKVGWWHSLAWGPGSGAGLNLVPSRKWGSDLTCIYDMGRLRGWARGKLSVVCRGWGMG